MTIVQTGHEQPHGSDTGMLTERESAVLDFERIVWPNPSAKRDSIRTQFGISPIQYYQVLNALIDTREALEYDPVLVRRLQRLRDYRQGQTDVPRVKVQ